MTFSFIIDVKNPKSTNKIQVGTEQIHTWYEIRENGKLENSEDVIMPPTKLIL